MHSWRLMTLPHYRDGKMLINGRHQFSSTELLMMMPWWDLLPSRDQGMPKPSQGFLASKMHHPHPTLHPSTLLQAPVFSSACQGFSRRSKCTKGCAQVGHCGSGRRKARLPRPPYPLERAAQHPNPLGKGVHLVVHQGRDWQGWGISADKKKYKIKVPASSRVRGALEFGDGKHGHRDVAIIPTSPCATNPAGSWRWQGGAGHSPAVLWGGCEGKDERTSHSATRSHGLTPGPSCPGSPLSPGTPSAPCKRSAGISSCHTGQRPPSPTVSPPRGCQGPPGFICEVCCKHFPHLSPPKAGAGTRHPTSQVPPGKALKPGLHPHQGQSEPARSSYGVSFGTSRSLHPSWTLGKSKGGRRFGRRGMLLTVLLCG